MTDYKIWFGAIAVIIALVSYFYYFRDIYRGQTKPHAFSWGIWGILESIAFAAQVVGNAGPGAWVTGITAFLCFVVAGIGLKQKQIKFVLFDWISLCGAALAILLWYLTKNPLISVILITITDAIGFLPTFRKAYYNPHQETVVLYCLSVVKITIGLLALTSFNALTALYPISLLITNTLFVILTLFRRRQLKNL